MTARLEHDPLLNRKARMEDLAEQGRSSLSEVRDALAARDTQRALDLIDCYLWETEQLYGGYLIWIKDWILVIGAREGEALWDYLARVHAHDAHLGLATLPAEIAQTAAHASAGRIEHDDGAAALRNRATGATLPLSAWQDAGAAERSSLEDEVRAGRWDAAAATLERLHLAHKPVHDAYSDWIWLWMTMLAEAWGEEPMIALIAESGLRIRTAGLDMLPKIPLETQVRHMAGAMRGHRSGPGEEGDIRVIEDDEKFTIEFDACGSGGRMRRPGVIDGLPARQDAPFNFGVTKKAHPMGWGLSEVPYYCLHCAAYAEMQSVDQIGYPSRVTLFNPDHSRPCAWAFYKRPEEIPQEYFDRIGKVRDPKRFVRG